MIYHLIGICLLNPRNIKSLLSNPGVARQPRSKEIENNSTLTKVGIHPNKSISRGQDVGLFSDFTDDPIEDGLTFLYLATWKLPPPSWGFNQKDIVSSFHENSSSDDMFRWVRMHLLPSG